jgi:hypothetical protein
METQNPQPGQRDDLPSDWPAIFRRRAIPFLTYTGISVDDTHDATHPLRCAFCPPRNLSSKGFALRSTYCYSLFVSFRRVVHRPIEELVQQPQQLKFSENIVEPTMHALPLQETP